MTAEEATYDLAPKPPADRGPHPVPETPVVGKRLLRRAAAGRPAAVQELAAMHYPSVCRIAAGLTGRADLAEAVGRAVVRLSVGQVRRWRDEAEPGRWFRRHTILQTRRVLAETIATRADALADPVTAEFMAAFRKLPHQQREAWLLAVLEGLPMRLVSQAMDCSTEAATNHLRQARASLHLHGPDVPPLHELAGLYLALTPAPPAVEADVAAHLRRATWPRRVLRWVDRLLALALLAGIGYGLYRLVPLIEF